MPEQISKNCYKDNCIYTVDQFIEAVNENKAIYHKRMRLMKPAKVFAKMQFDFIYKAIRGNDLYHIHKVEDHGT